MCTTGQKLTDVNWTILFVKWYNFKKSAGVLILIRELSSFKNQYHL